MINKLIDELFDRAFYVIVAAIIIAFIAGALIF